MKAQPHHHWYQITSPTVSGGGQNYSWAHSEWVVRTIIYEQEAHAQQVPNQASTYVTMQNKIQEKEIQKIQNSEVVLRKRPTYN